MYEFAQYKIIDQRSHDYQNRFTRFDSRRAMSIVNNDNDLTKSQLKNINSRIQKFENDELFFVQSRDITQQNNDQNVNQRVTQKNNDDNNRKFNNINHDDDEHFDDIESNDNEKIFHVENDRNSFNIVQNNLIDTSRNNHSIRTTISSNQIDKLKIEIFVKQNENLKFRFKILKTQSKYRREYNDNHYRIDRFKRVNKFDITSLIIL